MIRLLTISLLLTTSVAFAETRVVGFGWRRVVSGVSVVSSDKRVYWPGWDRKRIQKAIGDADARYWMPPNSSATYWIRLSDGRRIAIPLFQWARLDKGSEIK